MKTSIHLSRSNGYRELGMFDESILELEYLDGIQESISTWFHKNGKKKSEGNFKDDLWSGNWQYWYENGNKKQEANYKEGKLDGVVIDYDKTGKETSRRSYFQGILKSEFKSR